MTSTNILLQKPYLTISTPDIQNDVITLISAGKPPIKIPFDFKNCPVPVKVKLRNDVYLTDDECLLHSQLTQELNLPQALIISMVMQYALNDEAYDHRTNIVVALNNHKTHSLYLREFVKIPGHKNIFFVVDYDLTDCSLLCVEVDPNEPVAYSMGYVWLKQVFPTTWNDHHEKVHPISNKDLNITEEIFQNLIMNIPEVERLSDEYDE